MDRVLGHNAIDGAVATELVIFIAAAQNVFLKLPMEKAASKTSLLSIVPPCHS
jgi:hypothetical protein